MDVQPCYKRRATAVPNSRIRLKHGSSATIGATAVPQAELYSYIINTPEYI